ncbi:MAG TPA: EI24 domain-containing protein [Novosphingobium sp.]|nr:EI24 domain-containing protein [Novosphingobium sp.]
MLQALALALPRMADRHLLPIWLKSLAVTLLVFAALGSAGWYGLAGVLDRYARSYGMSHGYSGVLALLIVLIAGGLLWRILALAVLQFFADEVVHAIEARDYPDMAARARKLGLAEEARRALAGAARAILFNLAALPVALVLMVTGIGAPLVFLFVNAVLLGRELQDMVWLRHRSGPADPAPLTGFERLALGGGIAVLLTVPVVNFVAPFLGAACAVHLIHRKGAIKP